MVGGVVWDWSATSCDKKGRLVFIADPGSSHGFLDFGRSSPAADYFPTRALQAAPTLALLRPLGFSVP